MIEVISKITNTDMESIEVNDDEPMSNDIICNISYNNV